MENALVRSAVVQLDYYPALFADFRSPIEDPGGLTPLLPMSASVPPDVHHRFEKLRARVREAYCSQLLKRLESILHTCRSWEVKIVVLPEYCVPWDILEPLAHAAGPMVIVAGTHRVEPEALHRRLYQRLGCPEGALPRPGQAVAPILHAGRILALVPKLHAAAAANEEIEPGDAWQPVALPEGFPSPMGVLICLDFLHRESPLYQQFVAERLSGCRFLAVPSWTSPHSIPEFQAKAWEEAKRYGRPVLYADHASGGGTALFVDEERTSDLLPYPSKPGCLRPGEEGLLVADIDMGYERPGGSTRYAKTRPVKPQAAATLVYAARPLEQEYAGWLEKLYRILDPESGGALDEALAHVEKHRTLLGRVRDAATPTRRERLDRLLYDTRFISSIEMVALLAWEMPLHPSVLPMDALRSAHAIGAKEAVVHWMAKSPALVAGVAKFLEEASRLRMQPIVDEARKQVEQHQSMVRGRIAGDPTPDDYFGRDMVTRDGILLSFRRHAGDLEMRMSPKLASSVLGIPNEMVLPHSEHTPLHDRMDPVCAQVGLHQAQCAVAFSDVLTAEGVEPAAAVVVSQGSLMNMSGMSISRGAGVTFRSAKVFFLIRHDQKWWLTTYEPAVRMLQRRPGAIVGDAEGDPEASEDERLPRLDEASCEPIREAFEEWGLDIEGFKVVDDEAFRRRFDAAIARFEGARETVRALRARRLSDVGGHFIEPSLAYEQSTWDGRPHHTRRIVEPALSALNAWLGARWNGNEREFRAAILLGEYGSGKSTLLTEWASQLWEAPEGPRPLLVDLAGSSAKSPQAQLLEAARLADTPENRAALRLVIRSGRFFPVFDGFDEMATRVTASELPQRLTEIFDTAQRSGRIILSSRDHYFPTEGELKTALDRALTASFGSPAIARRFGVCFFSDEQVRRLLLMVTEAPSVADDLWRRIQRTYDLKELCQRPLLLAMIIATRRELLHGGVVRRGDLYEACLHRWLQQARGPEPEIFSIDQKRLLAETIAVETWRRGEPGVALDTLRRLLHESFPPRFFDDLPRTAEVLEATGGMFLVRQPSDTGDHYRFAHKSFQEYFLASAIVGAAESSEQDISKVLSVKPLTREVICFIDEILVGERGMPGSAFVNNLRRWLVNRRASRGHMLITRADAAANATRLLLQLARIRGDEGGWIPEKADLREVSLTDEDLSGARLVAARLEGANLCAADLSRAELKGANLCGARLRGAKLHEANLRDVIAEGADFTLVEASEARLQGARLERAVLRQSMWERCRWDSASLKDADVLGWVAPGAEGLGSDPGVKPTSASWNSIELAVDRDEQEISWEILTGDFSPDGARIAAVTRRGDLVLWDIHTHRCLAYLGEAIESPDESRIRWAADADTVVALDPNGSMCTFSLRDLQVARSFGEGFTRVAINRDGSLAAASEEDGRIRVMNLSSGEDVASLDSTGASVLELAFSADSGFLAIAYESGIGVIWGFTEESQWTFHATPSGAPIRALAFHPDDDTLAYCAGDFFIRFCQASKKRPLREILTSGPGFEKLVFSRSGTRLAGLSGSGKIRIWDFAERREISRIDLRPHRWAPAIAWSRDDSLLASFCTQIDIWDHERRQHVSTLGRPMLVGGFEIVWWSRSSNRLLCSGRHLSMALILDCSAGRVTSFRQAGRLRLAGWGEDDALLAVSEGGVLEPYCPDGQPIGPARALAPIPKHTPTLIQAGRQLLGACTHDSRLCLWDAATGALIAEWPWRRLGDPIRMTADRTGNLLAVGSFGTLDVLRRGQESSMCVADRAPKNPWAWDWDAAGEAIVFVDPDGVLWTWVPEGKVERRGESLADSSTMRSRPGGEYVAIGHEDGRISLLDSETLEVKRTTRGTKRRVCLLEWSHDGSRLASIDETGTLCIWDASRASLLLTITGAGGAALARTPGGYCDFIGEVASDFRLLLAPEAGSRARLYVPLGGLRETLRQPEKIAAALQGDLSDDDAGAALAQLGYLDGLSVE